MSILIFLTFPSNFNLVFHCETGFKFKRMNLWIRVKLWGHPEVVLGHPWVVLGHPGVFLDHPRVVLGSPRGPPGSPRGHPGLPRHLPGSPKGRPGLTQGSSLVTQGSSKVTQGLPWVTQGQIPGYPRGTRLSERDIESHIKLHKSVGSYGVRELTGQDIELLVGAKKEHGLVDGVHTWRGTNMTKNKLNFGIKSRGRSPHCTPQELGL